MRPNIDTHDYDVKMRNAIRFLEDEDKVKVTMRFRGREMAHQELGLEVLYKVRDDLADLTKVEFEPKLEGRQMTMILAPLPAKPGARKAKAKAAAAALAPDEAENEAPGQATDEIVEEPAEEIVAPDQVANEAPDQATGDIAEEPADGQRRAELQSHVRISRDHGPAVRSLTPCETCNRVSRNSGGGNLGRLVLEKTYMRRKQFRCRFGYPTDSAWPEFTAA